MIPDLFEPSNEKPWSELSLEQQLGTFRWLCQLASPDRPLIDGFYRADLIDFLNLIQSRLLPTPNDVNLIPLGPRKQTGASDGDMCVTFIDQLASFEVGQVLDADDVMDLQLIARLLRRFAAQHVNEHGQFQPPF